MTYLGYLGFVALIGLIAVGIPIGLCLAVVGFAGLTIVGSFNTALTQVTTAFWSEGSKFVLVSLPFYVLMGNLIYHTGIARNLFRTASHWLSWLPGGLGIASVFACAGFGAVSGSSTATARTMGAIVIPEMRRFGYGMRLATGVMSSAGTLGILIPPSIVLIFYGLLTETSVGKLFIAGILPGLIIAVIFAVIVFIIAVLDPSQGGKREVEQVSWGVKLRSLGHVLPVLLIFVSIFAGLYMGVFTPTESAIFGVAAVLLYGALSRSLSLAAIRESLLDAVLVSAMLFLIMVGGMLFTRFLAQTGFTASIQNLIVGMELSYFEFILAITLLYLVLGCVLDLFGMLILTIPILFPLAMQQGIDPVWFGIYVVIVAEIGLVTPPLGVNVFVISGVARDVPLSQIFIGCLPFIIGLLFFVAVMAVWPQVVLYLVP